MILVHWALHMARAGTMTASGFHDPHAGCDSPADDRLQHPYRDILDGTRNASSRNFSRPKIATKIRMLKN